MTSSKANAVGDLPVLTQADLSAGFGGQSRTSEAAIEAARDALSPELSGLVDSIHAHERNSSFNGIRPSTAQAYQMYQIQKEVQPKATLAGFSAAYGFNESTIRTYGTKRHQPFPSTGGISKRLRSNAKAAESQQKGDSDPDMGNR